MIENRSMSLYDIVKTFNIDINTIINVYPYGSRVYGTNSVNSDYDFIIVTNDEVLNGTQKDNGYINITFYSESHFEKQIKEHNISILECIFLPDDKKLLESKKYQFNLDINILRSSLSQKSSNSFVKAKKKFVVKEDYSPYIAKKSLFHSLRILKFGIQIATYGKIVNYSEANDLWEEIRSNFSNNWEVYKELYSQLYNNLKSEFRIVAPKEIKV